VRADADDPRTRPAVGAQLRGFKKEINARVGQSSIEALDIDKPSGGDSADQMAHLDYWVPMTRLSRAFPSGPGYAKYRAEIYAI